MTHSINTKEFGLNVIQRHDYDYRNEEIAEYTKRSCKYLKEFITNVSGHENYNTFIDVGCGNTVSLDYFKDDYEANGLDLYPAVEDDRIIVEDFYKLSDVGKFDIIFCNHTLEHSVGAPLIEQISKAHNIGGALFVAVPDGDYSWAYDITSSTTHWTIYNKGFLRHMFTRYGYECHVEKKCFRGNKGELFLVGVKRFNI